MTGPTRRRTPAARTVRAATAARPSPARVATRTATATTRTAIATQQSEPQSRAATTTWAIAGATAGAAGVTARGGADGDLQGAGGHQDQQYQGELIPVRGLLDLRDEGYGFLRCEGYLPSSKDVYVSISQARRFALRKGDSIEGFCRPAGNTEKFPALLQIDTVSGLDPGGGPAAGRGSRT